MQLPAMFTNPHLYDYLHSLTFAADGTVEFLDGAGQLVTTRAHGVYRAVELGEATIEVTFEQLVEVDSYASDRPSSRNPDGTLRRGPIPASSYPKLRDLPAFTARCRREVGRFAFRQEVIWNVPDRQRWPCLLFAERYVFDADPLDFGRERQRRNLFYRAEPRALLAAVHDAARYYYPAGGRELTWADLRALGIAERDLLPR